MNTLYHYTGMLAIWLFALLVCVYLFMAVVLPLLQSLSFHAVAVWAICRAGRASKVKWRKLPLAIYQEWVSFMGGGDTTISSDLMVWRGVFDWEFRGDATKKVRPCGGPVA